MLRGKCNADTRADHQVVAEHLLRSLDCGEEAGRKSLGVGRAVDASLNDGKFIASLIGQRGPHPAPRHELLTARPTVILTAGAAARSARTAVHLVVSDLFCPGA